MLKMLCCGKGNTDAALMALRVAVAVVFIFQGWGKLNGIENVIAMFTGLSFPLPALWAYLVAGVEFLGGIAILLGVYTRLAATLLAIIMVVALITVHIGQPLNQAFLAIAMLGATYALRELGSGAWALTKSDCVCDHKK